MSSRTKLIQEGTFRCQSNAAIVAAEPDAPQNPLDEYLVIASFVDRVIMQTVGLQRYLSTTPRPQLCIKRNLIPVDPRAALTV